MMNPWTHLAQADRFLADDAEDHSKVDMECRVGEHSLSDPFSHELLQPICSANIQFVVFSDVNNIGIHFAKCSTVSNDFHHLILLLCPFTPHADCPRGVNMLITRYSRFLPLFKIVIINDRNVFTDSWSFARFNQFLLHVLLHHVFIQIFCA